MKQLYETRAKINAKIANMTPEEEIAYFNRHVDEYKKMGIIFAESANPKKA